MQQYNTALLLACNHASVNVIRALVRGGADIEARNTTVMGIALLGDETTNGTGVQKCMQGLYYLIIYIFNYAFNTVRRASVHDDATVVTMQ